MSNIQAFALNANKRIFVGCFNHTHQCAVNLYIDDNDELDELLEAIAKDDLEITIECLEIDEVSFDTIRYFSELSKYLECMLDLIDQYDADMVADFINLFGLNQLGNFENAHTGNLANDFKDFAIEQAQELLDSENVSDSIQMYFDYDAFARDLEQDYVIGQYVWNNV
jgi:antirestriction protein